MSDIWVKSITHLKHMPSADTALNMLQKTASLVKPIMRRHGWVLPVLAEFFPDNPGLLGLNVNMGQKILVRLRYAGSPGAFLSVEEVVGTMLHELTHNVHGPHDDQFYKILAGLQDEYEDLKYSKYTGEGFYSKGRRLGENVMRDHPQYVDRLKALEAAEARRRKSRIPAGGSRLGGSKNLGLAPKEMAARAAEQRARDEKSCAYGPLAQREAEQAATASVESKVIDLTLDDDMTHDYIYSDFDQDIIIDDEERTPRCREVSKSWSCTACTLINLSIASHCDICGTAGPEIKSRVSPPSKVIHPDWSCSKCTLDNSHESWSCAVCGMIKD